MARASLLLLAAPLIAVLVGFLAPYRARRLVAITSIAATALSALGAGVSLWLVGTHPFVLSDDPKIELDTAFGTSVMIADFGDFAVTLIGRIDLVSAVLALMVTLVALAVQIYSVGYLREDQRYVPYAAQVSLFTLAMLTVVVAGDLLTLVIGWEAMGICSYLLIGHDKNVAEAPKAAVKAFLVTRVGDIGFLLGIIILAVGAGSFDITTVLSAVRDGAFSATTLTCVGLLLLAGIAGKSAQFPLHTWLPDAMAGPTPISALIHAATMVAAGVYALARLRPVFLASETVLLTIAIIGAITVVLGALAALAADDIKRVLAFSTMSQLGYMVAVMSLSSDTASAAALFHLLSHAGFKALLFLCAGALIHAVGSNLASEMGGLRKTMPLTFGATTLGLAALAGVPPFAGFWSKEAIVQAAEHAPGAAGAIVTAATWLAIPITAAYVMRLWLRVFFGKYRGRARPHDPPPSMLGPIIALTLPTVGAGLLVLWPLVIDRSTFSARVNAFDDITGLHGYDATYPLFTLMPSAENPSLSPHITTATISTILVLIGAALAWWAWRADRAADPAQRLGALRPVFAQAFYLDELQDALVTRPVQRLARAARFGDERIVDGAVRAVGGGTVTLGQRLAQRHIGLERYLTLTATGAVLLAVIAVVVWEVTR
ncbi:MAG: NADH-quinone oxidoreductase subunit L [Corynebacteriales bacterium]|nr:NADH-quinone oxidoreductase subunit L [Mycobacteriales bacterium]